MKIRDGFVSNSSSSSFCLYGAHLDRPELIKFLGGHTCKEEDPATQEDCKGCLVEEDPYTALDELLSGQKLTYVCDSDYGDVYIGRSLTDIKDNETGKQFKESVEHKLEKIFGKKVPCSTQEGEVQC